MGRKLTEKELEYVEKTRISICLLASWNEMEGGMEYWNEVVDRLERMGKHKTFDGQPAEPEFEWVEPKDKDALKRPIVECSDTNEWVNPIKGILLRVRDKSTFRFIIDELNESEISSWRYCRMPKVKQ